MRRAFSLYSVSIRSMWQGAATQTGFPPNVVPWSGLPGVHDAGACDERAERHPLAMPFALVMMSVRCRRAPRPPLAGAAHAD